MRVEAAVSGNARMAALAHMRVVTAVDLPG